MVIKNSAGDKRSSNNRSTVRRSSLPPSMDSNDSTRRSTTSLGIHDSRARPRSSMITNQSSNDKRQQQASHSQYLQERRSSGMGSFQRTNYPKSNASSSLRLPNNSRIGHDHDHWNEYDSYKLSKTEMERYHSNSYVMKSKEIYEKEKEKAIREACRLAADSRNRGNSGTIRRSRKPVAPPRPSRSDVSRASQTA